MRKINVGFEGATSVFPLVWKRRLCIKNRNLWMVNNLNRKYYLFYSDKKAKKSSASN
jgi:hypothetical protein